MFLCKNSKFSSLLLQDVDVTRSKLAKIKRSVQKLPELAELSEPFE